MPRAKKHRSPLKPFKQLNRFTPLQLGQVARRIDAFRDAKRAINGGGEALALRLLFPVTPGLHKVFEQIRNTGYVGLGSGSCRS